MKPTDMDLAALELRLLAQIKEKAVQPEDIFGKPWTELNRAEQRAFKAVNVAIRYGACPDWLRDGIKSGRFRVVTSLQDELVLEEVAPN